MAWLFDFLNGPTKSTQGFIDRVANGLDLSESQILADEAYRLAKSKLALTSDSLDASDVERIARDSRFQIEQLRKHLRMSQL